MLKKINQMKTEVDHLEPRRRISSTRGQPIERHIKVYTLTILKSNPIHQPCIKQIISISCNVDVSQT